MSYNRLIETAAHRFNVARCDLDYLLAHDGSPGIKEILDANDDYEYLGSLAEHECHLARLAKVKDVDDLTEACINLRDCGYYDPSVVDRLQAAARVVGDQNLIEGIASIKDPAELVCNILHGYGCANMGVVVVLMDGSGIVRLPRSTLVVPKAAA